MNAAATEAKAKVCNSCVGLHYVCGCVRLRRSLATAACVFVCCAHCSERWVVFATGAQPPQLSTLRHAYAVRWVMVL